MTSRLAALLLLPASSRAVERVAPLDMSPAAYLDPQERDGLYLARGFNPDLTNFTRSAFREITALAGMRLVKDNDEDVGQMLFKIIRNFERAMRDFISRTMEAKHGPKWLKQRVPGNLHTKWEASRAVELKAGRPDRPLIEFADIGDYLIIIDQGHNWREFFEPLLRDRESVKESLRRLILPRNAVMHSREATLTDEATIVYETARILDAIGS